jgi:predicted DNA-binding transcriptional regulator YafY
MPKGTNQKLKLLYLMKIMLAKTDDAHSLTMPEILRALESYDVTAERKSIYADFDTLRDLNIDIIGEKRGKTYYYHVASRQFEIAELKLLVDAIQSSKFITEKKSNELIKKLESLTSEQEAKQLQRQVYVIGRIKTMNESIYYNIDEIHSAISRNRQITFQYFKWNVQKKMELRKEGAFYQLSPWALCWDDENYYMVAFDAIAGKIKHYRVDKMTKISTINEERAGKEDFKKVNMACYNQKYFGMFGGDIETVKLEFKNDMANVVFDRFGKDIMIIPSSEDHFTVNVTVAVSALFLGWIFALGDNVRILGPTTVREKIKAEAKKMYERYQEKE